jgi:hypothetical protein
MIARGMARRLASAARPACRVRPAMFPMPTTRRACLPASSVTRASTTNEHDADEDHRGGAAGASRSIVVSTGDDPYAERKKLTFEEAERAVPLPTQLKLKEISQELRAWL